MCDSKVSPCGPVPVDLKAFWTLVELFAKLICLQACAARELLRWPIVNNVPQLLYVLHGKYPQRDLYLWLGHGLPEEELL